MVFLFADDLIILVALAGEQDHIALAGLVNGPKLRPPVHLNFTVFKFVGFDAAVQVTR